MSRARVGVVGASGFAGGELLRLLLDHPRLELAQAVSASRAGEPVSSAHPHLRGLTDLRFEAAARPEALDAVCLAGAHGDSMRAVPELLERAPGLKLVDLSGDFRLKDPALYPRLYGREHAAPGLLAGFRYGLPELDREGLAGAARVANPGCIATAVALSLAPLARAGWAQTARVTAFTGSSGSGSLPSAAAHHPLREGNVRAYKALRHQHAPEVEAALARLGGNVEVALVTVMGPFVRGVYSAAHLDLPAGWDAARAAGAFAEAYAGRPFVRLVDAPPELNAVRGSNFCDLHVAVEGGRLVVLAALDNLVKGAAGQAVQNLNLMLGFAETDGLRSAGSYP